MEKYSLKINGKPFEVEIDSFKGSEASVRVNGEEYTVEIAQDEKKAEEAAKTAASQAAAPKATEGSKAATGGIEVTSPLPGVLVDVKVAVGDSVKAGQTVAVLEAMKMENEIEATASGTVTAVCAAKGDSLLEGAVIVRIG